MDQTQTIDIDVYWAIQNGRRLSVSLSETLAWQSLNSPGYHEYDPRGWTVEKSHERVSLSHGMIVESEGECVVFLDDDGIETSNQVYKAINIFWDCPLCRCTHNTNLYGDPVHQTDKAPNPSIWFCEKGNGIVLVNW
jgi:hypothetical protein